MPSVNWDWEDVQYYKVVERICFRFYQSLPMRETHYIGYQAKVEFPIKIETHSFGV